MIRGAHVVISSTDADADRSFFADVLEFPSVDAGNGWLIFALPPAEMAIHPSEDTGVHELYLMCDDVDAFIADMADRNVACSEVQTARWGRITRVTLPGGGSIAVYAPTHRTPL